MSIRKYIAYLKTIETGSITQAATQLGYTQSAVSRMIADLEEDWGVTLLTRNRSGIEISSEGLTLLPKLQAVCKDYEDLNYAISELHGLSSGTIRVGAFSSISSGCLPQMIKDFHALYPHIDFQLVNGEYSQITSWLRRGVVDCGLVSMPAANDLDASFLLQDNLVAVLPENHPLADAPVYPIARLSSEDFINLKEEQDYEITKFLEHLQQKPNIRYEVSNDYAILSMVECGLGISVVHELMLRPNRYRIRSKHFDIPQAENIGIAVKKNVQPSTVTRRFLEHAKEWVRTNLSQQPE